MAVLKDLPLEQVIWVDPDRMSGIPCFTGTRVPIQSLLDHLEGGSTLDDFLDGLSERETRAGRCASRIRQGPARPMRILLDECVHTAGIKRAFPGHTVKTVPEAGWSGIKNGKLLALVGGTI